MERGGCFVRLKCCNMIYENKRTSCSERGIFWSFSVWTAAVARPARPAEARMKASFMIECDRIVSVKIQWQYFPGRVVDVVFVHKCWVRREAGRLGLERLVPMRWLRTRLRPNSGYGVTWTQCGRLDRTWRYRFTWFGFFKSDA